MHKQNDSPNWIFLSNQWCSSALLAILLSILLIPAVKYTTTTNTEFSCHVFNSIDVLNKGARCSIDYDRGGDSVPFDDPENLVHLQAQVTVDAIRPLLDVVVILIIWVLFGAVSRFRSERKYSINAWWLLPLVFLPTNVTRLGSIDLSLAIIALLALKVLAIGFGEELLSRAVVARFFRNHSAGFFIVVSSLIFAMLHDTDTMFFAGVVGACIAIAYVSGASIWYLALVHAVIDFGANLPISPVNHNRVFDMGLYIFLDGAIILSMIPIILMYLMHPGVWIRPQRRQNQLFLPYIHQLLTKISYFRDKESVLTRDL